LEKKYGAQFKIIFDAIRAPMEPAEVQRKDRIGYLSEGRRVKQDVLGIVKSC